MNNRQHRVLHSLEGAVQWLAARKHQGKRIESLRRELAEAFANLNDLVRRQAGESGLVSLESGSVRRARQELRVKHLAPIVHRGRLLLKGLPGIEESLRMPHVRASNAEWMAASKKILKAVRPHAKAFRDAGFDKDFVAQAERTAKRLSATSATTDTALSRRAHITHSIPAALRQGRDIVRAIDRILAAEEPDASTLISWRAAIRVPARLGRPRKRRGAPQV